MSNGVHVTTTPTAIGQQISQYPGQIFSQLTQCRGMAKKVVAPGMKSFKPTSPGIRSRLITSRDGLWKGKPYKPLTKGLTKKGGRSGGTGRITVRHRGGGHKRLYRIIDFKRRLFGLTGIVRRIEYDPNRTARIALIDYEGDYKLTHYIIAPDGLKAGDLITQGPDSPVRNGNALPIENIPVGTTVHNVELLPGNGGQLARSAGASCTLIKKDEKGYATLRLTSGEMRLVLLQCMATVGVVSNKNHFNTRLGKAGVKRWLGFKPTVRGVAMNPIDHPHGGGEGRTSGGRPSCTPWGVPTKGYRTRNNKRTDVFRVARRPSKNSKKK
ncbi:54S ribosomal protein L2 mitochondrial [Cymbomonas tetramitiformis]|uniref:Large ribosomal subunit protein uL2m n=1 Tax=Cymbomonas tetramitiformis TaxID=36881 RepID=A0AAE0GNP1_9CHLO|nr:54S ribosomal protein L2 mitochondrial [Cymbomonas tetramitiformis]